MFAGIGGFHGALSALGGECVYASEIDKYAITVTMANYPNTIQLGSVIDVNGCNLPKIDFLIGGSPCQSFSFAGKRKGMSTKDEQEILTLEHYLELKAEGYEFEGQSYLFWEFMRLLHEVKPKYFLLENVIMSKKWQLVLSKAIGVEPIMINSSLVSAQNRKRLYWTNIGVESNGLFGDLKSIIEQPKDKQILLKDILEKNVDQKYFLTNNLINNLINKSIVVIANGAKEQVVGRKAQPDGTYKREYEISNDEKSKTLETNKHKNNVSIGVRKVNQLNTSLESGGVQPYQQDRIKERKIITHIIPEIVSVRKYEVDIIGLQELLKNHKNISNKKIAEKLQLPVSNVEHWFRTDIYFSIPNPKHWLLLKELLNIQTNEFDEQIMKFEEKESNFEKTNRVYDEDGIAPTLTSTSANERVLVREIKQTNSFPIRKVYQLSQNNKSNGGTQPYQQDRIYDINGISPALQAQLPGGSTMVYLNENQLKKFNENVNADKSNTLTLAQGRAGSSSEYMDSVSKIAKLTSHIRRLTPIECERLQTVKDNYTNHVSDSQRYKMLGNGWTVDVIAHILSYANINN